MRDGAGGQNCCPMCDVECTPHSSVCRLLSLKDFGSEFLSLKYFHIAKESSHDVRIEIALRDMFMNSLGKLGG